jgi:glutathione S-transferase
MNAEDPIRLYELALENGRSASPFVWRVRFALAHKGLPFESVYLGFTEIPQRFEGRFRTVPIFECGATCMAESWDIAVHLDAAFPDAPPLFGDAREIALTRLSDEWFTAEVLRRMFRIYILDVHNAARPEDREYFRKKREKSWFLEGQTLEAFTADRLERLPALRDSLNPLRSHLKRQPYLSGEKPGYADYIVLGGFIWAASVGSVPMLKSDDTLRAYVERGFDLYGGMARDSRMRSLFE